MSDDTPIRVIPLSAEMPPALSVPVLCADLAKDRANLAAHPSYGYALLLQRTQKLLTEEIAKTRATFRIVR
jgi:hypothetical protein